MCAFTEPNNHGQPSSPIENHLARITSHRLSANPDAERRPQSTRESPASHIPQVFRISTLKDFLPLSAEDASLASPRGSHLPSIIQSRSSGNLVTRAQWQRRSNSITAAEMPALRQRSNSQTSGELELGPKSQLSDPAGGVAAWGGGDDQRYDLNQPISGSMLLPDC